MPAVDEDQIWGEAEVTYADWKGTAQLDERMTGTSLYDLVGLDRNDWMIIGLDLGGGEHRHTLRVLAVPAGTGIHNQDELRVTAFFIHDVDPYQVLQRMTHVFELRLRLRALVGREIRVVQRSDVPEQEEPLPSAGQVQLRQQGHELLDDDVV